MKVDLYDTGSKLAKRHRKQPIRENTYGKKNNQIVLSQREDCEQKTDQQTELHDTQCSLDKQFQTDKQLLLKNVFTLHRRVLIYRWLCKVFHRALLLDKYQGLLCSCVYRSYCQ